MITLKSKREIAKMRKAGLLVWYAHQIGAALVRPGITTGEIDERMERFFLDYGAQPLFKGVPGKVPFPATCCISVNEEVVHGIPGKRVLKNGDIVSIDTGCRIDGWCGDAAVTHPVGRVSADVQKLLDVTMRVLQIAIDAIPQCEYWSQVAKLMEDEVIKHGFSVVESLVGHGIGRELHEAPQVPNYVSTEMFRVGGDFRLQPGLVIAVEPMVNMGVKRVAVQKDHWTMSTVDRKPSAHFEHTLAVTEKGVQILTDAPEPGEERFDIQKYLT
ncbi:MAG: type I methionyl aminopeptidase [Planctomycetaceae bacterium]|nr:type I methionyl aminopeptidase [Planctomycetaceae bacterium]